MDLTPENLRARFAELGEQRDAMLVASGPLREQRDEIAREAQARIAGLDTEIRAAELGMFDLDQERALIARALGGKTGSADQAQA
ncbi:MULTISPECIES: hypothetical protein [unclassified Sphingomonas]|uniref:hypothetical protein n=1 Tax=unclassified Sphingomonas TaxID=196159 RepID=UPI00226A6BBC|nr:MULTISPECIES: hypothetical protein [unclassified Sphingomonas]